MYSNSMSQSAMVVREVECFCLKIHATAKTMIKMVDGLGAKNQYVVITISII